MLYLYPEFPLGRLVGQDIVDLVQLVLQPPPREYRHLNKIIQLIRKLMDLFSIAFTRKRYFVLCSLILLLGPKIGKFSWTIYSYFSGMSREFNFIEGSRVRFGQFNIPSKARDVI